MPRKKKRTYGEYTEVIGGSLYGSVNIPLGNGKYQRKRRRVSNAIEARQWAEQELHKNLHGEDPRETFTALAEWYKDEFLIPPVYQKGKKLLGVRTYGRQRTAVDRLVKYFSLYRLDNITVDVLRRYKRERLKTVSITAVNRDFALMRTMFKRAVSRKWMKENPFEYGEGLIEISLESPREATMTDRIAKRLLARSRKSEQPLLHYLILVMMHTGARPSEVFPLEEKKDMPMEPLIWKHILDYDFRAIKLVSYKGRARRERLIPTSMHLERGLRAFYEQTKPKDTDRLFPITTFKRSWNTLCRSVRIKGVVLRDFRRYYNTMLVNSKLDEVSRLLIMGHVEPVTNFRYASVDAEFIKRYRDAITSHAVN